MDPTDIIPPVVSNCPAPILVPVASPATQARANWAPEPSATDNSGVAPMVSLSHNSGDNFALGTTPVVYTFTDAAGNSQVCQFTVTGKVLLIII